MRSQKGAGRRQDLQAVAMSRSTVGIPHPVLHYAMWIPFCHPWVSGGTKL